MPGLDAAQFVAQLRFEIYSARYEQGRDAVSDPGPQQFDNVSVVCKANVYFNGGVVSHTVKFPGGSKKTLGLIYPGSYNFNTVAPEKMEIIAGACKVKLEGKNTWKTYAAGSAFNVPAKSSFEISVASGPAEYVYSFLS